MKPETWPQRSVTGNGTDELAIVRPGQEPDGKRLTNQRGSGTGERGLVMRRKGQGQGKTFPRDNSKMEKFDYFWLFDG